VSGEQTHQEHRSRDHRHHDRQSSGRGESDGGPNNRNRSRRSGGGAGKKGIYRFEDQLEHDICQLVTHQSPKGFPTFSRSELAILPLVEVARTESRILLCNGLHDGPHIWPNGDETVDETVMEVIVEESEIR
jgi:hypothetical protein